VLGPAEETAGCMIPVQKSGWLAAADPPARDYMLIPGTVFSGSESLPFLGRALWSFEDIAAQVWLMVVWVQWGADEEVEEVEAGEPVSAWLRSLWQLRL
jgi:hypothetical protein